MSTCAAAPEEQLSHPKHQELNDIRSVYKDHLSLLQTASSCLPLKKSDVFEINK